jgi:hypothetical protein
MTTTDKRIINILVLNWCYSMNYDISNNDNFIDLSLPLLLLDINFIDYINKTLDNHDKTSLIISLSYIKNNKNVSHNVYCTRIIEKSVQLQWMICLKCGGYYPYYNRYNETSKKYILCNCNEFQSDNTSDTEVSIIFLLSDTLSDTTYDKYNNKNIT